MTELNEFMGRPLTVGHVMLFIWIRFMFTDFDVVWEIAKNIRKEMGADE